MTKLITKVHYDGAERSEELLQLSPLTIMGIFVNQNSASCLLACVPFRQQKPRHRIRGPLTQSTVLDRSFLCSKQLVNWSPLGF